MRLPSKVVPAYVGRPLMRNASPRIVTSVCRVWASLRSGRSAGSAAVAINVASIHLRLLDRDIAAGDAAPCTPHARRTESPDRADSYAASTIPTFFR